MKNIIETAKANKKLIVKRIVIGSAIVATVVVVGVLYKANLASDDVLVLDVPVAE